MGSVTLRDTVEKVGDASDFFAWEDIKVERLTNAVKGFNLGGEGLVQDEEPTVVDIKVGKKTTKH